MIVTENGFFAIAGWEEYQNIEGMEKIREQNRLRQAKFKQKQKLLVGNVTDNVTVTLGNATDIELDKEKDKEIDFYTTTTTTAEPPSLTDVYVYFKKELVEGAAKEAEKFHAYNANKGWTCLPNWKATADLWIARIDEKG
jgi:hypothetical protein